MKLKDIPKEDLEKIKRFVREKKGKLPVKSDIGEDLIKSVKREFGYTLSAPQIYKLQRDIQTYRVNLPSEIVDDLERRYGSVGNAIKKIAPLIAKPKGMSARAEKMWKILLEGEIEFSEFDEVFKDWDDRYEVLKELMRLGFAHREGSKIVATQYRWNPLMAFIGF